KKQDCEYSQEVRELDGLLANATRHYTPFKAQKADTERSYELKVKPITRLTKSPVKKVSAQENSQPMETIYFDRACNEAPVGVVVGEPRQTPRGMVVPYGMLVAQFVNIKCDSSDEIIHDNFEIEAMEHPQWRMMSFGESDAVKISPP